MYRTMALHVSLCIILLLFYSPQSGADETQNWPQWRGPASTGSAPDSNPPVEWSEQQNIRWKTSLPGTGYSTPVIWGDDIFITAAVPPDNYSAPGRGESPSHPIKYMLMAIDRTNGKVKWERLVRQEIPHEGHHVSSTWATNSPITDGKHVYAYFGSQGLYCYTIGGDLVWKNDLGDMSKRRAFGEGSSPALHNNRLIVNWDHEGQSYIVALDAATGKEVWRTDRDERTTWMTPIVVEDSGRTHVITTAQNRVRSYDLDTGEILWDDEGLTANAIPSPVAADGVVYVTSGFRGSAMRAIRLSLAKGIITGTPAVLWEYNQDTPYVPSALLHGSALYFLKSNQAILTRIDIKTGKPHYSNERLDGISSVYASPVGAKDRIYVCGREGVTSVISHSTDFNILATNTLDDKFDASPVIVGDELYLRGHQHLYCIGR